MSKSATYRSRDVLAGGHGKSFEALHGYELGRKVAKSMLCQFINKAQLLDSLSDLGCWSSAFSLGTSGLRLPYK